MCRKHPAYYIEQSNHSGLVLLLKGQVQAQGCSCWGALGGRREDFQLAGEGQEHVAWKQLAQADEAVPVALEACIELLLDPLLWEHTQSHLHALTRCLTCIHTHLSHGHTHTRTPVPIHSLMHSHKCSGTHTSTHSCT